MSYTNLQIEKDGGVGVLTFNRPDALNALNRAVLEELIQALRDIDQDADIKVLVVTGAGKAFVAGADVREMKDMDVKDAQAFCGLGHTAMESLQGLSKPVIAAVNGFALGGGAETALACDFIYASEKARFGFPEINLGIFPGFGGTQRASRLIGKDRAKELILTGTILTAAEAETLGLVNRVFPADELLPAAKKTAATIASKSQVSVKAAKAIIDAGYDVTFAEGCALEREAFAKLFDTADQKEGMSAFLEKRAPDFQDA